MKKEKENFGISFLDLLLLLFIALKLIGIIEWSWWWVLSPVWVTLGFLFAALILVQSSEWIATKAYKRKLKNKVDKPLENESDSQRGNTTVIK